jgi:hypothetical protein
VEAQREVAVRAYGELLEMAYADEQLDAAEERCLEAARERHGITIEQHRGMLANLVKARGSASGVSATGGASI